VRALAVAAAVLFMTACQTMPYQPYAREVKKKPSEGGVIALKTEHRPEDRQKAEQLMTTNCGSAQVKVTEEGEVVVGQKTNSNASSYADKKDESVNVGGLSFLTGNQKNTVDTNSSSETTQLKEWQIVYNCVAESGTKKKMTK
jgi:hypothetical protein